MRRIILMFSLTAMLVVSAVPVASAQDRDDRRENRLENRLDRFDDGFFFNEDRFDNDSFFFVGDRFDDGFFFDRDRDRFNRFDFDGDGVSQDFEQETESGDVDQSFDVSGGGDNGSSCVNAQGVSNTGNVQDVSGFVSFDSDIDDFEQDDVGSELTVDGSSDVSCDQQVNQAAAAG